VKSRSRKWFFLVGLTALEQYEELKAQVALGEADPAEAQARQARGQLIDLIEAPDTDRQVIAAKQQEILAGQRQMQELVIGQLLAEKQVLTPQQQKELFDLLHQGSERAGLGPMMMGLAVPGEASSQPCPGTCTNE